jgi:hypothetical protein
MSFDASIASLAIEKSRTKKTVKAYAGETERRDATEALVIELFSLRNLPSCPIEEYDSPSIQRPRF